MTNANDQQTAAQGQTGYAKKMTKTIKFLLPAMLLLPVLTGLIPHIAKAQVDPGAINHSALLLFENGVQVGEAYILDRAPGQTQYAEDEVPYPSYVNAGPRFIGAVQVVMSTTGKRYASESDLQQCTVPGRFEVYSRDCNPRIPAPRSITRTGKSLS
jgi:hypothetical protein